MVRSLMMAALVLVGAAAIVRIVDACGPFWTELRTVQTIAPPHRAAYAGGELGIVRPRFARTFLVQAYRVLGGGPSLGPAALPVPPFVAPPASSREKAPVEQWNDAIERALSPGPAPKAARLGAEDTERELEQYQSFTNCPPDAFAVAVKTLAARTTTFGAGSAALRDWAEAQVAVFRNCRGPALALPKPAPASAPTLARADRAYQTAAAYFYATQYAEAERRFRAIGDDAASPWRVYGRYLAARSKIRRASITEKDNGTRAELREEAEEELRAVAADPLLAPVHATALGLIDYLEATTNPLDRINSLAAVMASKAEPTTQQMSDFVVLADRVIGDTVDYDYTAVGNRADLLRADVLDWVLAMQGRGEPAQNRALEQWDRTKSPRWLVAAMWKLKPAHPKAGDLLRAAADITPESPAFATLAFLRVRLLAQSGRADEARALLSTLPRAVAPGFPPETINLLAAERMMLATSLDEFIAQAPRTIVTETIEPAPVVFFRPRQFTGAAFDDDAASVLTYRMPLERLAAVAASEALPARLRIRVAAATLTRAILLKRDTVGVAAARTLGALAPAVKGDTDAYVDAKSPEERHLAGVLLLLRTPGMHTFVKGPDTDHSFDLVEPARTFDHQGTWETPTANWWFDAKLPSKTTEAQPFEGASSPLTLLYEEPVAPYPAFLTAAERAATEQEIQAIAKLGTGRWYLMTEALEWSKTSPADPRVAEALALSIEGWRWARGDEESNLPQRAFQVLHTQYPTSEWAKKTKYWYR